VVEILKVRFHCTHHCGESLWTLTSVQLTVFRHSCDYTGMRINLLFHTFCHLGFHEHY
jgi:hypothetical protein